MTNEERQVSKQSNGGGFKDAKSESSQPEENQLTICVHFE